MIKKPIKGTKVNADIFLSNPAILIIQYNKSS